MRTCARAGVNTDLGEVLELPERDNGAALPINFRRLNATHLGNLVHPPPPSPTPPHSPSPPKNMSMAERLLQRYQEPLVPHTDAAGKRLPSTVKTHSEI